MNINKAKELGYDKVYFTFDCIGDTILLMSGLKYIYEKEKKRILVGTYYKELLENCDYIEILDDFCEDIFDKKVYDELIKNGIQPIFISATDFINENDKIRPIWGKYHILANVCSKLGVESEIQISPEFYLTEKEKQNGRFFEKAQIAIVSAGNQRYKAIPYEMAQQIVNELNDKYGFVQVGSPSDPVISGVLDKRGKGGLRGTASILYNSDLYVGGIGGLMHMARAVECKSVIAFSRAEPIALENYICNINVIPKRKCCTLCGDNVQFPYLSTCHNDYSCIRNIDVKDVINAIEVQINNRNRNVEVERMFVPSKKVSGIEDYIRRFGEIR